MSPDANRSTIGPGLNGGIVENVNALPVAEDNTVPPPFVPPAALGEDIRTRPIEVSTLDTNPVETDYRAAGSGTPGTWGPFAANLRLWRPDFIEGAPESLSQPRPWKVNVVGRIDHPAGAVIARPMFAIPTGDMTPTATSLSLPADLRVLIGTTAGGEPISEPRPGNLFIYREAEQPGALVYLQSTEVADSDEFVVYLGTYYATEGPA